MFARLRVLGGVVSGLEAATATGLALVAGLALLNQATNVGATACFAASAHADRLRTFIFWQVAGGFFGLGVQVTFAGLVRYWSVTAANVIGIGVAFVSAQIFVAYLLYNESFHPAQWAGTALVFAGLVLIAGGR